MKPVKILTVFTALFVALSVASAGASAAGQADAARAEHQRIVDFWTHERVAQATPRDFVFDPATGKFSPTRGKPPGTPGGGGGDDDSGVVRGDSWPYDGGEIEGASGKVLFEMNGSYFVCSATVIDDGADAGGTALIITAAHCVYDEGAGGGLDGFAGMWTFIPDYDAAPAPLSTSSNSYCDDTRYGCWTAEAMAVHTEYAHAGGFNDQAVKHDFAVVRVGPGGHGSNSELDTVVVEQFYNFTGAVVIDGTVDAHAFGYPAARKYKGNDLVYCFGPVDGDPNNNNETYRLNQCEMTGGSSGGPWLDPFDDTDDGAGTFGSGTVISVNSYGYQGVKAMHGPFLNSDTQAVYDLAKVGGGIAG